MRRHDWPERLAAVVAAAWDKPFAWGRHDCALFACDCIAAMTGADHAAPFRGRYKTAIGAARALKRIAGVATLDELATRLLGAPIAPALAQRGDVIGVETEIGMALGVVLGARAAFVSPAGMAMLNIRDADRAWRVE